MPNWADCELRVTGKQHELNNFEAKARDSPYRIYQDQALPDPKTPAEMVEQTFHMLDTETTPEMAELCSDAFVPMPLDIRKGRPESVPEKTWDQRMKKKYGVKNQYDWCCKYWGSKWGICDSILVKKTSRSLVYSFQSPWAPPMELIDAMAKQHPNLKFKLDAYECGMAYQVHATWADGKNTGWKEQEYSGGRGG